MERANQNFFLVPVILACLSLQQTNSDPEVFDRIQAQLSGIQADLQSARVTKQDASKKVFEIAADLREWSDKGRGKTRMKTVSALAPGRHRAYVEVCSLILQSGYVLCPIEEEDDDESDSGQPRLCRYRCPAL